MTRWALPVAVLTALLMTPILAGPSSAANVPVTLIAFQTSWHVGSESAPPKPTITVNPGDVIQFRVENHDSFAHTFTFPHFSVNQNLAAVGTPGSIIFVNITTSTADNGRQQFYCSIPGHTTGTDPNRDGMVGWVQVGAPPPPPTPGFEVVLVIAALGIVAAAVRILPRRKK